MYSKNKGITDRDYIMTPPPGYDGSRFRHRSDGRDDAFLQYSNPPPQKKQKRSHELPPVPPPCEECTECCSDESREEELCEYEESVCHCEIDLHDTLPNDYCPEEKEKKKSGFLSFLQGIGNEELLLIALILLLSKDDKAGIETVLILALLLCIS